LQENVQVNVCKKQKHAPDNNQAVSKVRSETTVRTHQKYQCLQKVPIHRRSLAFQTQWVEELIWYW